jgi:hypothetical protein
MIKFITHAIGFLAILSALFLVTYLAFPLRRDSYMFEQLKKDDLLRKTQSPRIVLLGGSNLAFGVCSKAIRDSLHITTINCGLHAGLGLKFMLDRADPFLREGDIVVLFPEYEQFFGKGAYGDESNLSRMIEVNPRYISHMNLYQLENVVAGYSHNKKEDIIEWFHSKLSKGPTNNEIGKYSYGISNFNEFGDEYKHLSQPNVPIKINVKLNDFNDTYFKHFINQLKVWEARKIRIFILPPPVVDTFFNENKLNICALERKLTLAGFSFLYDPQCSAYPMSFFYDTCYHLNKNGVSANTAKIIAELRYKINIYGKYRY